MAVLRKPNFHSVDICIVMKKQSCKKRSRRKTDSNFNFFYAAKLLMRFKKKECSAYYRILFTLKNNIK